MKVHFIGIGGIGMSALARYFKAQGRVVSGSDMAQSVITDSLRKEGMQIMIGHKKGNIGDDLGLIVTSQAIREDNPELKEARKRGFRIFTYPDAIAELTKLYNTIATAGAHGKSTTTALTALTLIKGGLDPTVIVGTNLRELGNKNFRAGKGEYFVLEADEFGNAFSRYSPDIAIITNIDREHLDIYKDLNAIKKAFLGFMGNIRPGGTLIVNGDDKNLASLKVKISALAKKNRLTVIWYYLRDSSTKRIKNILKISGVHNLSNASAVYKLGKLLKISDEKIFAALGSYNGAWRRMEYRGEMSSAAGKSPVFDDYAHHPTEIRATLQAFREKFPHLPIICVFQPHQAQRLQLLFNEFRDAFSGADMLVLLPSYHVAGREDANIKFTAERLAKEIKKKYPRSATHYLPEPKKLKKFLMEHMVKGSVVIMMGAGNIVAYTDSLLS